MAERWGDCRESLRCENGYIVTAVHWFLKTASSKAVHKVKSKSTRVSRRDDRKVEWLVFEIALSEITFMKQGYCLFLREQQEVG